MDIATKLTQIAEKEAKNIELNNQLEQTLYGVDSGGKSYYDEFWDSYQSNGERRSYNYAFQALNWTDDTYNPKYPIVCNAATNIFVSNPNITDTKVTIDLRGTSINNTFSWATNLQYIREIIVDETTKQPTTPNGFNGLGKLTDLKITGVWSCGDLNLSSSKLLNKESIISIINALSDETGATLTLSKTAVDNAFETEEGLANGSESEDFLNLIASKANKLIIDDAEIPDADKDTENGLWTIALI